MDKQNQAQKKGVRIDHISKIYKDPKTGRDFYAVKDISVDIAPGTFVTLLGPSGCGKTTTLRMIAGFESPDLGEIYLGGEPINELTPNKRDTAMVFQTYALFPHYNVFDNVAYGLRLRKMAKPEIEKQVKRILDLVELNGMESRMPNQLSGGQQQRVSIGRALMNHPAIVLADEPTGNLDTATSQDVLGLIRVSSEQLGQTVVMITHNEEIAQMASRMIRLEDGKICGGGRV